jgi:hypothetical protein
MDPQATRELKVAPTSDRHEKKILQQEKFYVSLMDVKLRYIQLIFIRPAESLLQNKAYGHYFSAFLCGSNRMDEVISELKSCDKRRRFSLNVTLC